MLIQASWHHGKSRLVRFLRARFKRGEYLGLHLTIGFLISGAALLLFGLIARQVVNQSALTRVDLAVYQWFQDNATINGYRTWSLISQLGGGESIFWIGVGVAIILAVRRRRLVLGGWATALLGGGLLDIGLKAVFQRPRPEDADIFLGQFSWSFPSGHSLGSLIGYGMLAYVASTEFTESPVTRRWIIAACAWMVLAVGISRMYLGVHYLSDVLAGFSVGGLWLTACITGLEVARRLRKRAPAPAS